MELKSYYEKQLRATQSVTLEGILLDHHLGDFVILWPCNCVQDTPDDPCPCKQFRFVIAKRDLLGDPRPTGRTSSDGTKIVEVAIDRTAHLTMEMSNVVPAVDARNLTIGTAPVAAGSIASSINQKVLWDTIQHVISSLGVYSPPGRPAPPSDGDTATALPPVVVAAAITGLAGIIAAYVTSSKYEECVTTTIETKFPGGGSVKQEFKSCRG